jgi:hypothetical protein
MPERGGNGNAVKFGEEGTCRERPDRMVDLDCSRGDVCRVGVGQGAVAAHGSVANLSVVENARREGVCISCWDYCKVGVTLTVLTLLLGIAGMEWVRC